MIFIFLPSNIKKIKQVINSSIFKLFWIFIFQVIRQNESKSRLNSKVYKFRNRKMFQRLLLYLILFVLHSNPVTSYTAVSPTWLTSPYFRAGNQKVIHKNTNSASTPTWTFTFTSALTGVPNLAYGIKSYGGTDQLRSTNFQISRTSLSASTFEVAIQLFGSGKLYLLAVSYIAIDPTFPHHLNSFDNVPLQYSSTLTNITTSSAALTSYTHVIDYSFQSAANTYKTFTTPLTSNKVVLFITSFCVVANTAYPFNFDISYQILNSTHYSWTAKVFQYSSVSKVHFSEIIYNEDDVTASKLYEIVNQYWITSSTAAFQVFPIAFVDNMILGLTDFHAANGACGFQYGWDFMANYAGYPYTINIDQSNPAPNSSAVGGFNYVRSTLFYIKTWRCDTPYIYYNKTANMCQDACASYYYFNTTNMTATTCTACYYACYNCSLSAINTSCTQCEAGLQGYLVNSTCLCINGYFDDGFEPACKPCANVDPYSLTCTYSIDRTLSTSVYQNIFNQTTWKTDILPNFTSITCLTAYFVNTTRLCSACSSYCLTCTDATTCTQCNSSLLATLYTDNLCYLCNISNCVSCYPDTVCVQCSTGFILQNGSCLTCESVCQCNGWVLPQVNGTCSTLCGDGILLGTEQCDDGNTLDHDGCSSTCMIQSCALNCSCNGWTAPWVNTNSSCTSVCGDGLLRGSEKCDDGNIIDRDGCSSTCTIEGCDVNCSCDGWSLPVVNTTCSTTCGDGLQRGSQQCDDGNLLDHDGCSSTCSLQACDVSCLCGGWIQPWIAINNTCTALCGDGLVIGDEQCDDGNLNDGDSCNRTCQIQPPSDYILLTEEMSTYPALIIFAIGFRIVGLQALNVFQSFQLILNTLNITTFQLSFNIHGYTDQHNFPLPVPITDHIFTRFNFMYLGVIGLFAIGALFEVYYMIFFKSNKILDTYKISDDDKQKDEMKSHSSSEDHSDEASDDFTVHYKSQRKPKPDNLNTLQLHQSQIMKENEEHNFWGTVIFRQVFFDLLVNVFTVFVYSFVTQISKMSVASLINFQTMAVIISMIFLLAVMLTVCAVENHSFGENHLKFHKNRAIEFWVLIIAEKILFSAILASKQFWSLKAILAIKLVLLVYYSYASIYFEKIQKIRSVVTHLLHFLLILTLVLNKDVFKPFKILSFLNPLFIEYIYVGLLSVVLLLCFAFYIRQAMHHCQADFRYEDSEQDQVFVISNGTISAVFDVKNCDVMEDSSHPFNVTTMKGSNIFDDLKQKKLQLSYTNLKLPSATSHNGGAMAKKVLRINQTHQIISLPASATNGEFVSSVSKKNFQSQRRRSPLDIKKLNQPEKEDDGQIEEINLPVEGNSQMSLQNFSKSIFKPEDIKFSIQSESSSAIGHLQNQNSHSKDKNALEKPTRRAVLKNRRKRVQNENVFKTDENLDIDQVELQTKQKVQELLKVKNPSDNQKKQPHGSIFQDKKNQGLKEQLQLESLGDKRLKEGFQSQHLTYNQREKMESQDAFLISFE